MCVPPPPRYLRERRQFGAPLASFQLMQEKLARMLGNVNVSGCCTVVVVIAAPVLLSLLRRRRGSVDWLHAGQCHRQWALSLEACMGGWGVLGLGLGVWGCGVLSGCLEGMEAGMHARQRQR